MQRGPVLVVMVVVAPVPALTRQHLIVLFLFLLKEPL